MPRVETGDLCIKDSETLSETLERRGITAPTDEITHRYITRTGENIFVTSEVNEKGEPTDIKEITYPTSATHALAGIVRAPFESLDVTREDGV